MSVDVILTYAPDLSRPRAQRTALDPLRDLDPTLEAGEGRLLGAVREGVVRLDDALAGVGVDEARLELELDAANPGAEVHGHLSTTEQELEAAVHGGDLLEAVHDAFEELVGDVRAGELAAPREDAPLPAGTRTSWAVIDRSVRRHARHAVASAVRRGEVVAGRVHALDLADAAIEQSLARGRVGDPGRDLRQLYQTVDALLQERIAALRGGASARGLGTGPAVEERVVAAEERSRLTDALFELPDDERHLFSAAAMDGLPLPLLAEVHRATVPRLEQELVQIVDALSVRLGVDRATLLQQYGDLAETLEQEHASRRA